MLGCTEDEPGEHIITQDGTVTEETEPELEPDYLEYEELADFAEWDLASGIWFFQKPSEMEEEVTVSEIDKFISFYLPASNKHYYVYTFESRGWHRPPVDWDISFGELNNYDGVEVKFEYVLENDLDSFSLFFGQHDGEERIAVESWGIPAEQGNNSFSKYITLEPYAESYRVYLRFVNSETENSIELNSLKIIGYREQ